MPLAYDEYLVPRLYMPWGRKLVELAKVGPSHHVADIATGPGTVARLVSPVVGVSGRVAALDINPGMLAQAKQHGRLPSGAGVEYFEGQAEKLPFEDAQFHIAICQYGFQEFKDREAAMAEIGRVVRKGGRAAIAIWAPLQEAQYWYAVGIALKRSLPNLVDAIRAMGAFSDAAQLKGLLESHGYHRVEVHTMEIPLRFEDGVAQALASVRGTPFGNRIFELATVRHAFESAAKPVFEHFATDRGIVFPMRAHLAIAVKA
ncbi:MAG: class I SAM-dependent methyltransferase [Candidatus Eremiobacteraeota bacterium]|nr:class I SAM-dependent methyltransferase [Candidatus Eremiobacteraeota bacterium]